MYHYASFSSKSSSRLAAIIAMLESTSPFCAVRKVRGREGRVVRTIHGTCSHELGKIASIVCCLNHARGAARYFQTARLYFIPGQVLNGHFLAWRPAGSETVRTKTQFWAVCPSRHDIRVDNTRMFTAIACIPGGDHSCPRVRRDGAN